MSFTCFNKLHQSISSFSCPWDPTVINHKKKQCGIFSLGDGNIGYCSLPIDWKFYGDMRNPGKCPARYKDIGRVQGVNCRKGVWFQDKRVFNRKTKQPGSFEGGQSACPLPSNWEYDDEYSPALSDGVKVANCNIINHKKKQCGTVLLDFQSGTPTKTFGSMLSAALINSNSSSGGTPTKTFGSMLSDSSRCPLADDWKFYDSHCPSDYKNIEGVLANCNIINHKTKQCGTFEYDLQKCSSLNLTSDWEWGWKRGWIKEKGKEKEWKMENCPSDYKNIGQAQGVSCQRGGEYFQYKKFINHKAKQCGTFEGHLPTCSFPKNWERGNCPTNYKDIGGIQGVNCKVMNDEKKQCGTFKDHFPECSLPTGWKHGECESGYKKIRKRIKGVNCKKK